VVLSDINMLFLLYLFRNARVCRNMEVFSVRILKKYYNSNLKQMIHPQSPRIQCGRRKRLKKVFTLSHQNRRLDEYKTLFSFTVLVSRRPGG
jgi:hypothetical protein